MYPLLLTAHSWLRWLVLILAVLAVARAIGGRGGRPWTKTDNSVGQWFVAALDLQFLIGLLLYVWLSPITRIAFADVGAAMRAPALRFWAVEHLFGMIIVLALAHVGRVKSRAATDDRRRHTLAAIYFGIALIILLVSIPWPGMAAGRPLLRGF
jgi:hypothetical protein